MRNSIITIVVTLFFSLLSSSAFFSQTATIFGNVYDSQDSEFLIGVNIFNENNIGTITDVDGNFSLKLPLGKQKIIFKYIGYQRVVREVFLKSNDSVKIEVALNSITNQLDELVISANKYEEKLGNVPISMSVIKPTLIENKATRDAEAIIEQIPGVQINENQASIRGGSGWSYGAGSRVLVMVDGMPMLGGDGNDIKWTAIPLENISQIEILKGASSVLYGSSALNGVINIRTQYPKDKPITKINISNGFYMPGYSKRKGTSFISGDSLLNKRDDQTWWKQPQGYLQGNFTHLNKLNENNELVFGGSFMKDQGYRYGSDDLRTRLNFGWKHFSKANKGLSYGLNINSNFNKSVMFFLWAGADSALHALGGTDPLTTTLSNTRNSRIMIDPYISFISKDNKEHHLKTRFFKTDNVNNKNQGSLSDYFFSEYQFQQKFKNKSTLTFGITGSYTNVDSELYGDHNSTNFATYLQGDKKWDKVTFSAGMRMEYFKIDSVQSKGKLFQKELNIPFQPVFRLGGTYNPFKYTFLRVSYGQGFRFPSIAEKYISTFVGGLNVFPNANIQPEYGWSSEIGIKQGFAINNFKGYIDFSAFLTQYTDMMEFVFGVYDSLGNDLSYDQFISALGQNIDNLFTLFGARSSNVQNAIIPGFEINLVGEGEFDNNISVATLAGYTFINPMSINPDSAYLSTFSNPDLETLKYRNKHMFKMDFQINYKKIGFGISCRYLSLMQNIDKIFETDNIEITVVHPTLGPSSVQTGQNILSGYGDYRRARMNGDIVFDTRLSYTISNKSKFSILFNNMLNREYTNRPGNVLPPRTVIWQYSLCF